MKRAHLFIVGLLLLGACNTSQIQTGHQVAEKADTEALNLYAAIGLAVNTWEASKPTDTTRAEQLRSKAWSDLTVANTLYNAGQAVDLTPLTLDLNAAKAQ
jgi:hypothetical protein